MKGLTRAWIELHRTSLLLTITVFFSISNCNFQTHPTFPPLPLLYKEEAKNVRAQYFML